MGYGGVAIAFGQAGKFHSSTNKKTNKLQTKKQQQQQQTLRSEGCSKRSWALSSISLTSTRHPKSTTLPSFSFDLAGLLNNLHNNPIDAPNVTPSSRSKGTK